MIYTVALIGLCVCLVAKSRYKYSLELSWLIIFIFLAMRYDFGNDYMSYYDNFKFFNSYTSFDINDENLHAEPGWVLLCRLFQPVGFFGMVICLTAFQCWVYYKLIKQYVDKKWQWFAVFIFVFDPYLMLVHASMMRQALAAALFVFAIRYIINRKIIPYLLIIYLATTIHKSAIILYPMFFLGYIKDIRFNKYLSIALIALYCVLAYISKDLLEYVYTVADFVDVKEYTETYSLRKEGVEWGIGALLSLYIFGYTIFSLPQFYNKEVRLLILLMAVGTFIKPFADFLPMVGRLAYYFSILTVVCYPIIISNQYKQITKESAFDKSLRWLMMGVVVLLTLYSYREFFNNEVWQESYSVYRTIFSAV